MMNKRMLLEIHRKLMDTRRMVIAEGEIPQRGTFEAELYEGITSSVWVITKRLRDLDDQSNNYDLFPADQNEREV